MDESNENAGIPADEGDGDEFKALQSIVEALQPLSPEARQRIVSTATTFLRMEAGRRPSMTETVTDTPGASRPSPYIAFSSDEQSEQTPKEFLLERQPKTDVERLACLAYYLTHYRDTPHFKTLDLSKLNTEAAQPKFSNAASSANNAVKRGYLVPSTKGQRQLSAAGEQFVRALPDRDAARQAMAAIRPRRRSTKGKGRGKPVLAQESQ